MFRNECLILVKEKKRKEKKKGERKKKEKEKRKKKKKEEKKRQKQCIFNTYVRLTIIVEYKKAVIATFSIVLLVIKRLIINCDVIPFVLSLDRFDLSGDNFRLNFHVRKVLLSHLTKIYKVNYQRRDVRGVGGGS